MGVLTQPSPRGQKLTNDDLIQLLRGQLLATQAVTHVLVRSLTYGNLEMAREIRRGLADVYDVMPSTLSGPALDRFNAEWEQIARLIPPEP